MNRNELIKFLILNSDLSFEEISQALGVNRSNIYLWRKGRTKPKSEHINKLCSLSNIEIEWIDENNINLINQKKNTGMKETPLDHNKIIALQDDTIKLLKEKINHLEKRLTHKDKFSDKNSNKNRSCNFQIITKLKFKEDISNDDLSINFQEQGKRKVVGDTSCLGYSNTEIEKMSDKELLKLYHPSSLNDGVYNTMLSLSDNTNNMLTVNGIRLLKSKKGNYQTFNCKTYFERNSEHQLIWKMSAYYNYIESTSS